MPKNVSFVTITREQFQSLATKKLGFSTKPIHGYKICDFRPSLGYLFPELIKEYEFWGYGDICLCRVFFTCKLQMSKEAVGE